MERTRRAATLLLLCTCGAWALTPPEQVGKGANLMVQGSVPMRKKPAGESLPVWSSPAVPCAQPLAAARATPLACHL